MDIMICPLSEVAGALGAWRPSAVLSLLSPSNRIARLTDRPHGVAYFHDIEWPATGLTAPDRRIVGEVVDFARAAGGPRARLLIHCKAGLSRSPAAAIVAAWAVAGDPERRLRELAALAPWAQPNRRVLAIGAGLLGHDVDGVLAATAAAFGAQKRAWFGAVGPLGKRVTWRL